MIFFITKKKKNVFSSSPQSIDIKETPKIGYRLCPGLSLTKIVRYTYKVPSSTHVVVPIVINGTTLDYHLFCSVTRPHITINPIVITFDSIDLDSMSDVRKIIVTNLGEKSARFIVDLGQNASEINVQPNNGLIKPNGQALLEVQVTGKRVGVFCKQLW